MRFEREQVVDIEVRVADRRQFIDEIT